jgi:transformation/transcription domain-associated protein
MPHWIRENDYVIDVLVRIWTIDLPQLEQSDMVRTDVVQRYSLVWSIFKIALQQSPRIDLLFEVVSIFTKKIGMNVIHIIHFLYHHVALGEDLIFKRNILYRFLTWFDDVSYSPSSKASFLRYVVTPTLLIHAARSEARLERPRGPGLVDSDFVDRVHSIIWKKVTERDGLSDASDTLTIEIIHFTTVMVQHYSPALENVKKDIMKAAWHYIAVREDPTVKHAAYLLTARFFETWQSPQKFIVRTWNGLLRSQYSDARPSIRQQALVTLARALPSADSDSGPSWAATARRFVIEEGLPHAATIFNLVVKEPAFFYPVRDLFVPHMVTSLAKLGIATATNPEMRILSIDMLQVMVNWDIQAKTAPPPDVDPLTNSNLWLTPLLYRENMLGYLVRLLTSATDPAKFAVVQRATPLLKFLSGSKGWSDVAFGLRFFGRHLEVSTNTVLTGLY